MIILFIPSILLTNYNNQNLCASYYLYCHVKGKRYFKFVCHISLQLIKVAMHQKQYMIEAQWQ